MRIDRPAAEIEGWYVAGEFRKIRSLRSNLCVDQLFPTAAEMSSSRAKKVIPNSSAMLPQRAGPFIKNSVNLAALYGADSIPPIRQMPASYLTSPPHEVISSSEHPAAESTWLVITWRE